MLDYEEGAELTGPVRDGAWVRQTLGDLVVLFRPAFYRDKEGRPRKARKYETERVSPQGGLTGVEMFVPRLCVPLSAFTGE